MKNRHFVNMLPAFGISPSGDFQFSLSRRQHDSSCLGTDFFLALVYFPQLYCPR